MLIALLRVVFSLDHAFTEMRSRGISDDMRDAIAGFWNQPEFRDIGTALRLVPASFEELSTTLTELADGTRPVAGYPPQSWLTVAARSEEMASTNPVAASIVALEAMAAWTGVLGPNLFFQPFQGHHFGWHYFPLSVARNLVAAKAIWGARHLIGVVAGFIEAAHDAYFNEPMQRALAEYHATAERAERIYTDSVAELAWKLRSACGSEEPNFRAEVAALFWANGDVIHAELLSGQADAKYIPTLSLLRNLLDTSIRRIPDDPLQQYIWLEMKDRPPVDLRSQRILFGQINNRFGRNRVHMIEEIGYASPSRAFARAAIGYFRGALSGESRGALGEAFELHGEMLRTEAPLAYVRMAALVNLVLVEEQARAHNWEALTDLVARIISNAETLGYFELLDPGLDIPFYYIPASNLTDTATAVEAIERYRCGNLRYWLLSAPPLHSDVPGSAAMFDEERDLLAELRGARFIRMLPDLPSHYGRYGFNMDDMDRPIPEGATADENSATKFNPFDQDLALKELRDTLGRLKELHERMKGAVPEYAAARIDPCPTVEAFVDALQPPGSSG